MDRRRWQEPLAEHIVCEDVPLERGGILNVGNGRDAIVFIQRGLVWLTQEGDRRDILLGSGDWFRLERDGLLVLQAHRAARITVTTPVARAAVRVYRPDSRAPRASASGAPKQPRSRSLAARWLRWVLRLDAASAGRQVPYL